MSHSVSPLAPADIEKSLETLPGFTFKDEKLHFEKKFKDFKQAFAFLTQIALYAESQDHHPEIFNCYATVELKLTTHDAGNKVSKKDIDFAAFVCSL